jgi:hypothetical protein
MPPTLPAAAAQRATQQQWVHVQVLPSTPVRTPTSWGMKSPRRCMTISATSLDSAGTLQSRVANAWCDKARCGQLVNRGSSAAAQLHDPAPLPQPARTRRQLLKLGMLSCLPWHARGGSLNIPNLSSCPGIPHSMHPARLTQYRLAMFCEVKAAAWSGREKREMSSAGCGERQGRGGSARRWIAAGARMTELRPCRCGQSGSRKPGAPGWLV